MKIAQVSPYDHDTPGGVREHVRNLTAELTAAGHTVKIIAPSSGEGGDPAALVRVSRLVVPFRLNASVVRASPSPAVFPRMRRILAEERFDVVHIHEPLAPAVSLAALLGSDAVTVGHFHGFRDRYWLYDWCGPILRSWLARLDSRAAVSAAALRGATRYFPGEYVIIPDGVDAAQFGDPSLRPIERFDDGMLNVLFVGRMDPRKGFRHLLEAFPIIKQQAPQARLIVAGAYSPRDVAPWVERVRHEGWRDIEFVGPLSDNDLPRYYRAAHVFCAPSTGAESLGIVLLEAMASGTPIVASNIEGYRSAMTHQCEGMLVPPTNPAALAQAILSLLADPNRRQAMARQGRLTAQRFAWPQVARQTLALYEDCLARRRAVPGRPHESDCQPKASRSSPAAPPNTDPGVRRPRTTMTGVAGCGTRCPPRT